MSTSGGYLPGMARPKKTRALPRGPHGLSREQVEQSQRNRLLMAMVDAVAARGYSQTSVADVLERSGVSRATFYAQFKDKEDCFRAAYETAAGQIATMMTNGLRALLATSAAGPGGQRDPFALIDRVLTVYFDILASQPALARTFLIEVYAAGPKAIEQRRKSLDLFIDLVMGVLRTRPGLFGPGLDQRFAVTMLVNAISSMVTNLVGMGEYSRLKELKEPLLTLARDLSKLANMPPAAG